MTMIVAGARSVRRIVLGTMLVTGVGIQVRKWNQEDDKMTSVPKKMWKQMRGNKVLSKALNGRQ